MVVCVALFRGINVGRHGRLAMRDLVSLLQAEGLRDVATYVQSGNAVFRCQAREVTGPRASRLAVR